MGALGKDGESLESFTIITIATSPGLTDIQHRQPAIVDPAFFAGRLNPSLPVPWLLDLVREPYAGPYEQCPISTRVNNVGNDDPDILAPRSEKRMTW